MTWRVRAGVAMLVMVIVMLVGFSRARDWLPTSLADDAPSPGSLRGHVHLVEIASRPDYRLVEVDLDNGDSRPLFIVPETGVIYAMAEAADGESLIMAYSTDYTVPGTGLYRLPLPGPSLAVPGEVPGEEALQLLVAERRDGFFTDVVVGEKPGVVWATLEERGSLSIVGVDTATGTIIHQVDEGVEPVVGPEWVAFLIVEPDDARRSIGMLDLTTGTTSVIEVLDRRYDLGNLLADPDRNRLLVTALVPEGQNLIDIGDPAAAHGAHDGPAQWLAIDLESGAIDRLVDHEPISVRDAALLGNGEVASITGEGLVVAGDPIELLVESRLLGAIAS